MKRIVYRSGYKYQLMRTYTIRIPIIPPKPIHTDYISLSRQGDIIVKKGYAWDGPSWPAVDTSDFMRGSLIHDALYQLMREGHLDSVYRAIADCILYRICREDGMILFRAWYVYLGVRLAASSCILEVSNCPILYAP